MKRLSLFIGLSLFTNVIQAQHMDSTTVLEGKLTRENLESFEWFKHTYQIYKPYPDVLNQLSEFKNCSLLVVLGTWCSDSRELIPQLYRVADMVGWEKIELIGVDRKKQCSSIDIRPLHIEYVPVIMIFDGKQLVGRIVETTIKSIEEDLLELLTKFKHH